MSQTSLASMLSQPPTAGMLLRRWRDMRGKSQLDLALDTGISQKHVSFVETGRSTPSRQMVIDISDALQIPLRERNAIIMAAGYAPIYGEEPLDAPAMQSVRRAIDRMLRQHEPFPAVVMDRYWNVITTNEAAPRFFGRFVDLSTRPAPRNLLHLMFDPAGMQPFLLSWKETARNFLLRVHREAIGRIVDERTQALLAELTRFPDVPRDIGSVPAGDTLPMVPLKIRADGFVLDLFSMVTTVGTPQTTTAEEIRVETLFPSDEASEAAYLEFMARDASGEAR